MGRADVALMIIAIPFVLDGLFSIGAIYQAINQNVSQSLKQDLL